MPGFAGRIVTRLRDQDDFDGPLTDEYFLSYEADTDSFVLAPVSAGIAIGSPVVGGTPGSVLFIDAAGDLGEDNANFFWDDTLNNLFIGGEILGTQTEGEIKRFYTVQPTSTGHGPWVVEMTDQLFTSTIDPVRYDGYNLRNGSNLVLPGEPGLAWVIEADFEESVIAPHNMEIYIEYRSADTLTGLRPFFLSINRDDSTQNYLKIDGPIGVNTGSPIAMFDVLNTDPARKVAIFRGAAGQAEDFLTARDNAGNLPWRVEVSGQTTVLSTASGVVGTLTPVASTGIYYGATFAIDTAGLSGTAGWQGLEVNRFGASAGGGQSRFLNLRDEGAAMFTIDNMGELFWKPLAFTGNGSFRYDGANTLAGYGFFRAQNAQDGVSLRNALTTDDGSGIGFRLSVTDNSPYGAVTNDAAKVLVLGTGQGGSALDCLYVTAGGEVRAFRNDAAATTVTPILYLGHNTSGSVGAGFGASLMMQLETTTTPDVDAGSLSWEWVTATHVSRKARGKINAYDTAVRECIRFEADGSNPMLGFLGASSVVRQTVTGSRGANAALASFLTGAANLGLITDSTTAGTFVLDDLTDVVITGGAQGDVLYRNATEWVNLAAGTSGQFLKTLGAGANPIWDTVAAGGMNIGDAVGSGTAGSVLFVGAGPVLAQDNTNFFWDDTDNMLLLAATPPASATKAGLRLGAALSGASANGTYLGINAASGFTGDMWRTQLNGTTLAHLNASTNTKLGVGPGAESISVPGSATSLVLSSTTGDRCSFYMKQGASVCQFFLYADGSLYVDNDVVGATTTWRGAGFATRVVFADSPRMQIFTISPGNIGLQLMVAASQTADMFMVLSGATILASIDAKGAALFRPLDAVTNTITIVETLGHSSSGTPAAGYGGEQRMTLQSSTTVGRAAAGLSWEWATATDASRKALVKLNVYDTAVREVMRGEASGTAPMVGFLGAASVVRQTLSAAATDPATTQTLCNDLRTALINLGLAA